MSRCISEIVVCGVVGEFTDETLRLYLETLSSSPERSNTVFRQEGDINLSCWTYKILSGRRVILITFVRDTTLIMIIDISVRGGGAGGAAAPPVGKKVVFFGQNWCTVRAKTQ